MPMPPNAAPNHASEDAKDGTERTPPISAAIGLSATTTIHGAPYDTPRITSDNAAVVHEVRVSIVGVIRLRRHPGSRRRRLSESITTKSSVSLSSSTWIPALAPLG